MKDEKLDYYLRVRVETETIERLQKIGKELDRQVSWLVRQAVEDYLKRFEKSKK